MVHPIAHDWVLTSEEETLALGEAFANYLIPGLVITLDGGLGAGKTTLTRGVLKGLGYSGRVKSPTYPILESYELSRLYLYHFDFYRIYDQSELEDSGFRENFSGPGVCVVEWPEKAGDWLPNVDIKVVITTLTAGRKINFEGISEVGCACLENWQKSGWVLSA